MFHVLNHNVKQTLHHKSPCKPTFTSSKMGSFHPIHFGNISPHFTRLLQNTPNGVISPHPDTGLNKQSRPALCKEDLAFSATPRRQQARIYPPLHRHPLPSHTLSHGSVTRRADMARPGKAHPHTTMRDAEQHRYLYPPTPSVYSIPRRYFFEFFGRVER